MSMPKIECCHVDTCCAAASLLQSIALQEAGISHILNAEGEKLQKAISISACSHEDLLRVNKSVIETIDKITDLELILKEKLDLILPILIHCEKEHCEKDHCDKDHCDKDHCDERPRPMC